MLPQQSLPVPLDLREMLRTHIVGRSLECMARAAERRQGADASAEAFAAYRREIVGAVRQLYGGMRETLAANPLRARTISRSDHAGFRIENVLFESHPGWEVNASVFVPAGSAGPYRCIVVPVGHSDKCQPNYQRPCAYFARAGFLAITFDPPGCSGEKREGNDHFADGVRDYLLGETSSRYFVADALRCIDYLATRPDADVSAGVAMTGVSGGGTTTTFAALLDERVTIIGPSCCLTPLADLDITQGYCGCPETHAPGRYALGLDEIDLLCAAAPRPCLLMAGEKDEVFRIEDTRRLAGDVARIYAAAGGDFRLSVDPGGHGYSLAHARKFAEFARQHFGDAGGPLPDAIEADFPPLARETFSCQPDTSVNMRTVGVRQAAHMAANWHGEASAVREAAASLCGFKEPLMAPRAEMGEAFRVWTHDVSQVLFHPEPGIALPATWVSVRGSADAPVILHFDDAGRNRWLHRYGPLTEATELIYKKAELWSALTVDLRGWGDCTPSMHPYEVAGWGSVDRTLAYAANALGDPLPVMRVRDALAALAWLRMQAPKSPIILSGSGLGGIIALHAAACTMHGGSNHGIAGVYTHGCLSSFTSLLAAAIYPWPADAFFPGVLRHYDLPELAASLGCEVVMTGLLDGMGNPAPESELSRYNGQPRLTASSNSLSVNEIAGALRKTYGTTAHK